MLPCSLASAPSGLLAGVVVGTVLAAPLRFCVPVPGGSRRAEALPAEVEPTQTQPDQARGRSSR
jgi:hypothetical protein